MAPTILDGDELKIVQVLLSDLKRGDLVLISTENNGNQQIKRLIGLPNETVSIDDGKIFINGNLLIEEYKVNPLTYTMDEIKLDSVSYFVLGDNRPNSSDSHLYGPVKGSAIQGKAIPWNLVPRK